MATQHLSDDAWDDLVDRLAAHDIRYLMGGSKRRSPSDAPVEALLRDLAHAPDARLHDALIALLIRHPTYTAQAEQVAHSLPVDDPARRLLLVSIVVAAALQNEWGFSLDLYLPEADRIAADQVAAELGLPSPAEDFGRPCLRATSRMLQRNAPFPFNFESGWEDSVHRLLSQLKRAASRYGT